MASNRPVNVDSGQLPSLGAGLHFMRKSASHEPLGLDASPSSRADSDTGTCLVKATVFLSLLCHLPCCVTPSGVCSNMIGRLPQTKLTLLLSESAFLVGSSAEDDVFAEGSSETAVVLSSPSKNEPLQTNPSSIDAQGIYPGTACMFVANLSQPYDDRALELEVTKCFSQFGEVWVKIKRDGSQMPFAFCQFTKDDHAQNAVKFGKGMVILGRPCRTEMARAHSSFIVFKKSGDPTSLSEATDLLSQLGEVAKAEFLHEDIQASLHIPRAVLVTYKMYDNRRDPVKYFAQSQNFLVIANDPKRIPDINAVALFRPKWDGGRELMEQYDKDRRSAFVGNLPLSMSEELLRDIASSCGEVVSIQLYKKMIPGGNGTLYTLWKSFVVQSNFSQGLKHCFGFVEFKRPDAADDLVTSVHGSEIEGHRVRVERKHSRTFTTPQRAPMQLRHVRSTIPRRRLFGDSEVPSPADGLDVTSPTGGFRASVHAMTCNSKSFSYSRGRRPRATIFNPDTSVGKALSSGDLRHAASQDISLCQETSIQPSDVARLEAISLSKKAVEFQLPGSERAGEPVSQGTVSGAERQAEDPTTPNHETRDDTQEMKPRAGSPPQADCNVPFPQPPPMSWVPTYSPYGYPYVSAPMTPQGGPGMMYGGYMAPPFYGAMYDMFGNLMLSPTPMMSPYPASHPPDDAPGRTETTDTQQADPRNAPE
ncbi:hypothetical protein E4U43_002462 [Claviceps pusilla]|uniref:RRM domain-containing protein n=1 Tax=Claviceps pusilla TaxID=123648 RepID=A0A9P7N8B3_9HYPO|nr:hypothetical protein E4U43_002462 [Claviceps pusilla]